MFSGVSRNEKKMFVTAREAGVIGVGLRRTTILIYVEPIQKTGLFLEKCPETLGYLKFCLYLARILGRGDVG